MTQLSQWRTIGIAAGGMLALLLGLLICAHWPAALVAYPAFAGGVLGCVGAVAVKAAVQHRANAEVAAEAGEPAATILAKGAAGAAP